MTPKEQANLLLQEISVNLPDSIPYISFAAAIIANELGLTNLDGMCWTQFEYAYHEWLDSDLDLLDSDTIESFNWGME